MIVHSVHFGSMYSCIKQPKCPISNTY